MHNVPPEVQTGNLATTKLKSHGLGVYVHYPFCIRKCPYCDFASFEPTAADASDDAYADLIETELRIRQDVLAAREVTSIFFGGGTPSLWAPNAIGRVISLVCDAAGRSDGIEVTLECNPSSISRERAAAYVAQGVTRLSIGVQSLDAKRLEFLGREHSPHEAMAALESALLSGAQSVSADLIFAVEGGRAASAAESKEEARAIAASGVHHVSAYGLTIEPGTPFGSRARRGRLPLAREEVAADSFTAVESALRDAGFSHYEVSNYAQGPSFRCRHNADIWEGGEYVGLGSSAVGAYRRADGWVRYRNEPNPGRYATAVARGEPASECERLEPDVRLRERIMLGLRIEAGIDVEAAALELGAQPWPASRLRGIRRHEEAGRLVRTGPRLRVPREHWLFCDGIAADLF